MRLTPKDRAAMESAPASGPTDHAARWEWFLVLGTFVAQLLGLSTQYWGDGELRGEAIKHLVDQHQLTPILYSYVGPIFSVPFLYLDRLLNEHGNLFTRYNFFVLGIVAGLAVWKLHRHADAAMLRRFLLLILVASMFPFHLTTFYGEVFSAVTVALGLALLVHQRSWFAWVLIVLGVLNTPALLVAAALALGLDAWQTRRFHGALALVVSAVFVFAHNALVHGSPFTSGYEGGAHTERYLIYGGLPGFSYPFFFGVLSLLFTFGRGLLFFAPGLWLLPATKEPASDWKRVAQLWGAFSLGILVVYARWWAWHGAGFWGPRYFLFVSLLSSLALAVWLTRRPEGLARGALLVASLSASLWVGLNSAVFHLRGLPEPETISRQVDATIYVPEMSPLWYPFISFTMPPKKEWPALVFWFLAAVTLLWGPARSLGKDSLERARAWWTEAAPLRHWKF
jgi:hypothetical protein